MRRVNGFWRMRSLNAFCVKTVKNDSQFGPHTLLFCWLCEELTVWLQFWPMHVSNWKKTVIEMHSRWLPHEAGWEDVKSVKSCHQGKGWLFWRISNIKYILICLTLTTWFHTCYFIVLMSSLLFYKTLILVGVSKLLTGTVYGRGKVTRQQDR